MSRRSIPLLLACALVAAGCNSQMGRSIPACDEEEITNSLILEAQSVRGAAYVPCVEDLRPGWEYEHLEARSGLARFWLSSDRVGHRFLEVTFRGSCDPGGAVRAESDEEPIPRFVDDVDVDFHLDVTVIPEGDDEELRDYAEEVAHGIGATRVEHRLVRSEVDGSDAPTAERIRLALAGGGAALVVGAREYEERTVELHLQEPGAANVRVISGITRGEAVEEIAEELGEPTYVSVWYYPFQNGCVVYRIDAAGTGLERISREVMDSLGFLDLGPIREYGEQVGYVLP